MPVQDSSACAGVAFAGGATGVLAGMLGGAGAGAGAVAVGAVGVGTDGVGVGTLGVMRWFAAD